MIIIPKWPPNIKDIQKRFDLKNFTPVFTLGNKLYNPFDLPLPEDLMVHEEVHKEQQKNEVYKWWDDYLSNDNFRLWQEIEAYRSQFRFIRSKVDRKSSRNFLNLIAKNLASELYGNIVDFKKAKELIKKYD